jgi:transposase
MEEGMYMTHKEVTRSQVCLEIRHHHISQTQAAQQLNVSLRQMQRIYKNFKKRGSQGIVSQKRGRPSNHQLDPFMKARVLELSTCENYKGFGPTFMNEKLANLHNIKISIEKTRQLMIENGTWHNKKKKSPIIHQQRKRRARRGELLQVDGSPHAWFEDRRDPCVLLVFVDDATGHTYGQFFEAETTAAYMITLSKYIKKNGIPLAIYSDKYSVFRVNQPGVLKKDCVTQFGRALKELEIKLIYANSPQAKGRVERANQTLQDRLVKELRLVKINTIVEANNFLESYWEEYNKKFEKIASNPMDAHKKLNKKDLNAIFCFKEKRKVSKNLEIQYKNTIYQIKTKISISKMRVEIWEDLEGKIISINYQGKPLAYCEYGSQEGNGQVVDSKEIDRFLKDKQERKPGRNHPWLQEGRVEAKQRILATYCQKEG